MSEDKRIKKYFENMPYGDDAKSSEIHGKHNQVIINRFISDLVKQYDALWASGDKENAQHIDSAIKDIARQLDNLKEIKKEFAVNYGGGVGGKNLFSNYTDLTWERQAFAGECEIGFSDSLKIVITVFDKNSGELISKEIEDITQDWVIKGDEEAQYMTMHQDLVKQGQTAVKHPDFNIDWAVDNLLLNNDAWKIFVSDKIGGRYFLHDYLMENQDKLKSGEITDDMLHPLSFNPENDNRLHKYLTNRINKGFDQNYMSQEGMEADKLMAKLGQSNESTQQTKTRDKI